MTVKSYYSIAMLKDLSKIGIGKATDDSKKVNVCPNN